MKLIPDPVRVPAGGANVTLHSLYGVVTSVIVFAGGTSQIQPSEYTLAGGTIVPGAPSATEVQFTGTPQAPADTLTFGTALPADSFLLALGSQDGDD